MTKLKSHPSYFVKRYFEGCLFSFGWVLLFASILILILKWYVGLVTVMLGYILVSTEYRVGIDSEKKQIIDYLLVFGMKASKEVINYQKLDCIFIVVTRYNQQLNHQSISTNVRGILFKAYLKTDDRKIYLGEDTELKKLEDQISPIARKFDLTIKTP